MIRWKSAALGAAVFVAAHLVLTARWREWFQPGGDFPPWFLNSGRAVALTAGVAVHRRMHVVRARRRGERGVRRSSPAAISPAGAIVAMCVVLALHRPGHALSDRADDRRRSSSSVNCVAGALDRPAAVGGG